MVKNGIFIAIIVLILMYSCSGPKNDETLYLGVMSSMDYLPLAVAEREGYFEKLGLDIKIRKFYSANDRDAAFQSNNVDGIIIDYTGAIIQKAGGIELKLVSKCDAPFYIVAGAGSTIHNIYGLKGKKVAVSQNTVIDYCVDMALLSAGLNPADILKIEINKIPLRYEMLRNNQIDVTGLPDPFALMAENEGDKILTSNEKLGLSITGIIFSENAINTKKQMIGKMFDAYNLGVNYLNNHSIEEVKDILVMEFGFPENITSKARLPRYNPAAMPSAKDIDSVKEWLVNRRLIENSFDKNDLLDSQFINN